MYRLCHKTKKHRTEKQGISTIMIRKNGTDSGAKSGRKQPVYTPSLEKFWLSFHIELQWETK
jgi:hypothetical protein